MYPVAVIVHNVLVLAVAAGFTPLPPLPLGTRCVECSRMFVAVSAAPTAVRKQLFEFRVAFGNYIFSIFKIFFYAF